MLDIKPIKDNGITSCFDVQLEAFGIWKQTGYELMYLDNWKFVFKEAGAKGIGIWQRGQLAPRLYFDDLLNTCGLFSKFHGVNINTISVSLGNLHRYLDYMLMYQKLPVLLLFDTYFLPWLDSFYGKTHSEHTIMVIGKGEEGYYCNDTRPFLQEPIFAGELNWETIKNGYLNCIRSFQLEETDFTTDDIYYYLHNIRFSMFDDMRKFADYLLNNNISYEDISDFGGGNGILIRAIRNISRARYHFCETLRYLNGAHGLGNLDPVIKSFYTIIEKWDIIKGLFYKAYLENNFSTYNNKIAKLIYELADLEEKNANILYEKTAIVSNGDKH